MATYYIDSLSGSDSTGTGASGNPWQTIGKAIAVPIAAGDIIYAKASANYNEVLSISVAGTNALPIKVIGYGSSIGPFNLGDGVQATIDGQNTRTNCVLFTAGSYWQFHNIIFQGATVRQIDFTTVLNRAQFRNCKFTRGSAPNTTIGYSSSNSSNSSSIFFLGCEFFDMTTSVLNSSGASFYGCIFHKIIAGGFNPSSFTSFVFDHCIVRNNGSNGLNIGSTTTMVVRNCVIRNNSGSGFLYNNSTNQEYSIFENNVFLNNSTYGISATASLPNTVCFRNNYFGTGSAANSTARSNNITMDTYFDLPSGEPCLVAPNAVGTSLTNDSLVNCGIDVTTSAGQALKTAALYQTYQGDLAVNYWDAGVAQHQDTGGTGGGGVIMNRVFAGF